MHKLGTQHKLLYWSLRSKGKILFSFKKIVFKILILLSLLKRNTGANRVVPEGSESLLSLQNIKVDFYET